MTSKLTRERIELIANFHRAMTLPPSHAEIEELARMALAALDSEPVAYISKSDFDAGYPHIPARRDFNKACTMPVYAAQPTPVVPKSISVREAISALESEDAVTTIGRAYKWAGTPAAPPCCRLETLRRNPIAVRRKTASIQRKAATLWSFLMR